MKYLAIVIFQDTDGKIFTFSREVSTNDPKELVRYLSIGTKMPMDNMQELFVIENAVPTPKVKHWWTYDDFLW